MPDAQARLRRAAVVIEPETLSGWAGTLSTHCQVARVGDVDGCRAVLEFATEAALTVCARGAGLSWADSAQNHNGIVLDTRAMHRVVRFDDRAGRITVEPGVTLGAILATVAPAGWTLRALPGTTEVTVGGALGANVHGKDAHHHGCFADQVASVTLLDATGALRRVDRESDPDLLAALSGGLGLLGIVVLVELRLAPRFAAGARSRIVATKGLDALIEIILGEPASDFTLGWLDCMSRPPQPGFAQLTRFACDAPVVTRRAPGGTRARVFAALTPLLRRALTPLAVHGFNRAVHHWARRAARRGDHPVALDDALLPHRRTPAVNRIFAPQGFIEIQALLPRADLRHSLPTLLATAAAHGLRSIVCALKRHRPSSGYLAFAGDGVSVSLVTPVRWWAPRELTNAAIAVHAFVAAAKGCVYLGKDQFLDPKMTASMFPEYPRFLAARQRVDPHRRFVSDLGRRVLETVPS